MCQIGTKLSFCLKRGFFRKINKCSYCLPIVPIMLQCLKKALRVGQIMRYKVLQFWANLNTNHPFNLKRDFFEKLTDVNCVYFMYSITIRQFQKKIIQMDHKIQGCIIFGQIGPGNFSFRGGGRGGFIIVTFVNLLCSITLKGLN